MRWADTDLLWGRPLRSILAVYNREILAFSYGHLRASDCTVIEKDLDTKVVKVKTIKDYQKLLLNNKTQFIMHYARQDLLWLKYHLGATVENIFCTKLASKIARTASSSHGYKGYGNSEIFFLNPKLKVELFRNEKFQKT